MSITALETVLRRDRAIVLAALVTLAGLAWTYIVRLAMLTQDAGMNGMSDMDMPGMNMPGMNMPGLNLADVVGPGLRPWGVADAVLVALMWGVMMVSMMLPSAAPMILIYARVARQAEAKGQPFAAAAWFAGGYLLTWTGFALVATAGQWGLENALLLTPAMASASNVFGGLVLLAAGVYQWTPLKESCLSLCQAPFTFIQRQGGLRRDPAGALRLGIQHGVYCVGCCWALMALLFVGGVMNLLWIAAIALFVLIEKLVPAGRWLPRAAGAVLGGAGALLLVS
jgi:predicted metal-binding membrane protein